MTSVDQPQSGFDVILSITPPPDTRIFDYISIFIQRAISEKAGLALTCENCEMRSGPSYSVIIHLKSITSTARDLVVSVLQKDGYGVSCAPNLHILVTSDQDQEVA